MKHTNHQNNFHYMLNLFVLTALLFGAFVTALAKVAANSTQHESLSTPGLSRKNTPNTYNYVSGNGVPLLSHFDQKEDPFGAIADIMAGETRGSEDPFMSVFPKNKIVEAYNWKPGTTITVTFFPSEETIQKEADSYGKIGLMTDFEIEPGHTITMTYETDKIISHTVAALSITSVDKNAKTVSGKAESGAEIDVYRTTPSEKVNVIADEEGNWVAEFSADFSSSTSGRAQQSDAAGNSTIVGWNVPKANIHVYLYHNVIMGVDWPPNTTITLQIEDETLDSQEADQEGYVEFQLESDINADQLIKLYCDDYEKTYRVTHLQITGFDKETNAIFGTAEPGTKIGAIAEDRHGQSEILWPEPEADQNGDWTAVFSNLIKIEPGTQVFITQGDGHGNLTIIGWEISPGITFTNSNQTAFQIGKPGSFTIETEGLPYPEIQLDGDLPDGIVFEDLGNGSATLSGTPDLNTEGTYPLTITARNRIYSSEQEFTLFVVNSEQAQVRITSPNYKAFVEGEESKFIVEAIGNPSPVIKIEGTLPDGITFKDNGDGSAELSGIPANGSKGEYRELIITAGNGFDSDMQNFRLDIVKSDDIFINFISPDHAAFKVGDYREFLIVVEGIPKPAITLDGSLPDGLTFIDRGNGTAHLFGVPEESTEGIYNFDIIANNGYTTPVQQDFTLNVVTTDDKLIRFTSTDHTVFIIGTESSFVIDTTGDNNPSTIIYQGELPDGIAFTDSHQGSATLAGNPVQGTLGSYPLFIIANNDYDSDVKYFYINVGNLEDTFVRITTPDRAAFKVGGESRNFQIYTEGIPAPTLTIEGALPKGITFAGFSNGHANLSGSPASGTEGTYPLTLTAKNNFSEFVQAFTLTVVDTDEDLIRFTSPDRAVFIVNEEGTFNVKTTGGINPVIEAVSSVPNGFTFTDRGNGEAELTGTADFSYTSFLFMSASTSIDSDIQFLSIFFWSMKMLYRASSALIVLPLL